MCNPPQCEDIYVMAPDGTNPTRLTHGGAAPPNDPAAYNSGGADWSHSKKLIAFQSNRVDRIPQIHLMNLDGTEQQLLVSVPGGAAFPSFSQSGNELCFHGFSLAARHLRRERPRHRPDQPHGPLPSARTARAAAPTDRRQHPLRLVTQRECDRIHQWRCCWPGHLRDRRGWNRSAQADECGGQRRQRGVFAKGRSRSRSRAIATARPRST